MWKVLKLVSGIIALGTSLLTAVAATGTAGDGLAETLGGAGDEKRPDGAVSRKASGSRVRIEQGAARRRAAPFPFFNGEQRQEDDVEKGRSHGRTKK